MLPKAPVRNAIPIPTYRIDLSLPPEQRYLQLASNFAPKMRAVTPLFEEVLSEFISWPFLRRWIESLASIFLRRVYSDEETRELRGIAKASGVQLYFLVVLNVILDSLLGCTSGGVLTALHKKAKRAQGVEEERMLHFRTLDWDMPSLRSVLVVLEFVRSASAEPEKVIARTVTYAGFTGVLTGVREDLSVSLNFRGNHHCSTLKLRFHQLLVLFGFRPSICSLLKNAILPGSNGPAPKLLDDLMTQFSESQTAPCYLIICDGQTTAVIEKDLIGAKIRTSNEFIVHTNHDTNTDPNKPAQKESSSILGMETVVEESEERRACVQKKWDAMKKRYEKKQTEVVEKGEVVEMKVPSVREDRLREWVRAFPITNECTHFTCIMDPETARIRFLERGPDEEDDAPSMELSSW